MRRESLQEVTGRLDKSLPSLRKRRDSSPFANDVYEAVDHWHSLGERALHRDAKVNYGQRVREERVVLEKLVDRLQILPPEEQAQYLNVLGAAPILFKALESVPLVAEGYLGTIAVLKAQFAFLEWSYRFRVLQEDPTGIRYSSGAVYVELQCSIDPVFSCSFGPERENGISFWIEDLLFLHGDREYRTFGMNTHLDTKDQVQEWFSHLAHIWKHYGREVLTNQLGIFDRLKEAQALRDQEYAAQQTGGWPPRS